MAVVYCSSCPESMSTSLWEPLLTDYWIVQSDDKSFTCFAFAHTANFWGLPWFLPFQHGSLSSLGPNQMCPPHLQRAKLSSIADICFTTAFWNYCIYCYFFVFHKIRNNVLKIFLRQCYLVSMYISIITKKIECIIHTRPHYMCLKCHEE